MPRPDSDLEKVTVNLRYGDMDFLHSIGHRVGVPGSLILRKIIAAKVDELRAKLHQDTPPAIEVDL